VARGTARTANSGDTAFFDGGCDLRYGVCGHVEGVLWFCQSQIESVVDVMFSFLPCG